MKILIAEDNRFYRVALENTLRDWGYEVVAAGNGPEALEILQQPHAPQVAILDWMMPGLDGIEVCRRIRAVARPQPTYIILLTARDGKENIITGLRSGADDYIAKPFDSEELRARLQVGLRIVGLQNSLAQRVKDLEESLSGALKLEALGRLAGGVAHDFNNLLTVIIGSADLMRADGGAHTPHADMIEMIRQSAERGAALTRQLLAFSRKQVLAPVVLNVNHLIRNVEKILSRLIGEHIALSTALTPSVYPVCADPGQLEQVLINLVVNARDAMPDGGTLTIATGNADLHSDPAPGQAPLPAGAYAVVKITDTGCGMDEHTRRRIFEPFFTTKEVGRGTGLGLATVYGIIKQSDGAIHVESTPGKGTCFTIYLPRSTQAPTAREPMLGSALQAKGQETVLVVEDEGPVRTMTSRSLRANNYRVLEARDGVEALAISDSCVEPIDLVLTDVIMPRLTGPQLAETLMERRPATRVLLMSGYADSDGLCRRVVQSGMPFLQKPFTPDALARKVREVLDQKKLRSGLPYPR
jgi:two-component system cell cycle sensor histidine kinase/response regulator CckA